MSGIDLRKAAIDGDDQTIKDYIIKRCNPCSVDDYGLSSLHYAVWNGHIECVKLLVCNTLGVNSSGHRCSSMELVSSMGYTALHLAALDCPQQRSYETTTLLLLGGAKLSAISEDRRTPLEIAEASQNEGFLSACTDFTNARDNAIILNKLTSLRDNLNKNYCFQTNTKTRGTVEHFEAKFTLPDFLFLDTDRTGNIPEQLRIHEHQIRPLTRTGFSDMEGLEAISCLSFTMDQALINKHRRERLLELAEPDFKPSHVL